MDYMDTTTSLLSDLYFDIYIYIYISLASVFAHLQWLQAIKNWGQARPRNGAR